jgi:hypothetical protein
MFTWICPTCGREVPPSYDECPDCAAKAKASGAPAEAAVQPPPPPPAAAPYATPPYMLPPPRAGLPVWLLTIIFALGFLGLGAGVYWLVHNVHGSSQAATSAPIVDVSAKGSGQDHPLQKYVEVTGVRFMQNGKKQTEARFVVVNHSGADITGLAGNVNIWGRTNSSEEEAAGTFTFRVPSLGPYDSKEMTAPVSTKLKVYELPDWQNVSTQVQITAP